jgi:hypothetical protein
MGRSNTVNAPLRQLTAGLLRRFGVYVGAVLMLILVAGLAQAQHPSIAGDALAESVAVWGAGSDDGAEDCPHDAYHQHPEGECCLGLACVPALLPGVSTLARQGGRATAWSITASAVVPGATGGQFRPPRLLLTV